MTRKVCYITGTRADYGLMARTLRLARDRGLNVSLCVTGMHLLSRYGETVREIEADGLRIAARVPVHLDGSTGGAMARAIAAELAGLTDALERERPDIVLVLGDRGEMLAGALAAIHLNIPIVHIHGGERSGTVDEPVRHAISKLAHFHFVATTEARERLIRMGERPEYITVTGAPGLDDIYDTECIPRGELCRLSGLDPLRPIALVVFHPITQEAEAAGTQMRQIMEAVLGAGLQVLAFKPNADAGGTRIELALAPYGTHRDVRIVTHLPRHEYISWMAAADLMVGNSSSGIIEAASLGLRVINVGDRQRFRERNTNTVDVPVETSAIAAAVRSDLKAGRGHWRNIYGDEGVAERIVEKFVSLEITPAVMNKVNAY